MRKYVSLGSAMMIGVVLGKEKASHAFTSPKHTATASKAMEDSAPTHAHYLGSTKAKPNKVLRASASYNYPDVKWVIIQCGAPAYNLLPGTMFICNDPIKPA